MHICHAQALAACPRLPAELKQTLLNPQRSKAAEALPSLQSCVIPRALREALASRYNAPQQNAVAACLGGPNRVTLVQGPPGTGKTACIVAMVSALLLQNASEASLCSSATPGSSISARRVLVCAQSNAAIDELCARLQDQVCEPLEFHGLRGCTLVPPTVRIRAESPLFFRIQHPLYVRVGRPSRPRRERAYAVKFPCVASGISGSIEGRELHRHCSGRAIGERTRKCARLAYWRGC